MTSSLGQTKYIVFKNESLKIFLSKVTYMVKWFYLKHLMSLFEYTFIK